MPVRSSTSELRAWVRRLISDPAGDAQRFSEQEIQDLLDERRATLVQEPLEVREERAAGGVIRRRIWRSVGGDWEIAPNFYDEDFNEITPAASDLYVGQWSFAADYGAVSISGNLHDVYGAAAAAIRILASLTAADFDIDSGDEALKLSQPTRQYLALAEQYEIRSAVWKGRQYRDPGITTGEISGSDFTDFFNRGWCS